MSKSGSTPSQSFIPISDINQGVVFRKDGVILSVLMVTATNLALKSPEEQQATIIAFQNFLNTLEFSVQIVAHSRAFDIRPYVKTLEERLEVIPEELLRIQTAMYIEYVKNISETHNIMQKEFYVIVPLAGMIGSGREVSGIKSVIRDTLSPAIAESEQESKMRIAQLEQRVNVVIGGLSSIGLAIAQLSTEQLIELFYELYNPGDSVQGAKTLMEEVGANTSKAV